MPSTTLTIHQRRRIEDNKSAAIEKNKANATAKRIASNKKAALAKKAAKEAANQLNEDQLLRIKGKKEEASNKQKGAAALKTYAARKEFERINHKNAFDNLIKKYPHIKMLLGFYTNPARIPQTKMLLGFLRFSRNTPPNRNPFEKMRGLF